MILYLSRDKESNSEVAAKLGLTKDQSNTFRYTGLEVECDGYIDYEGFFFVEKLNGEELVKPVKI